MSALASQPAIVTADLHDQHYETVGVIDLQFRRVGRIGCFFGPCATLQVFEDHLSVREILGTPGHGRILVVDGGGSLRVGVMGDRLASAGVANG